MAIEADDFSDLAVTFAREVLGWDKAVFDGALPHRMILKEEYGRGAEEMFGFDYGQIDDVHTVLRQWCEAHEPYGFSLRFTRRGKYIVTIQNESIAPPAIMVETAEFKNAGHAMLTACLEADRKLRGVT
jgi:hypothetical protein